MRRAGLLLLIFAIGCDSDPEIDAGLQVDAGMIIPDAGPPFTCVEAVEVMGVLDGTVSQMVDTSAVDEQPRDLGLSCGNTSPNARWAKQAVIALTIPGTGPVAVSFTTVNEVTPTNMNVVVQAREDCERVPEPSYPPVCYGAVEAGREWRSAGIVPAMGGQTLYFIVTGFSEADRRAGGLIEEGPVQIDFTIEENRPPTAETAELVLIGDDLRVDVTGTDPDANARSVVVNFYDANGLVDLYGTGAATPLNSLFFIPLDDARPMGTSWSGGNWVRSVPGDMRTQLGELLVARDVDMARVIAVDELNGASEPIMAPVVQATIVGFGDSCDVANRCDAGYECGTSGTCEPSAAALAQCAMATDANLPAFTDQAVTVSLVGQTGTEPGNFTPLTGCVAAEEARGPEEVYSVEVSAGTFDLLLSTDTAITGRTDTFVYVRTDCGDPSTQLECSDDISATDLQTELELRDLAPGTYFVFVEQSFGSGTITANHAIDVTARPVLGTGAACDDAEVLNRCAAGPCAASVCP